MNKEQANFLLRYVNHLQGKVVNGKQIYALMIGPYNLDLLPEAMTNFKAGKHEENNIILDKEEYLNIYVLSQHVDGRDFCETIDSIMSEACQLLTK